MVLDRLRAQMLLTECTGDDIWSVELCEQKGIPRDWIEELSDGFESGFRSDSETIYYQDQIVNQYEGICDVDLAVRLAEYLGIDTHHIVNTALSRTAIVRKLKEAVEEG